MNIKDIQILINKNYSTRQIAKELKCSQTTVRYWMKKYNLKTSEIGSKAGQKLESDSSIYEKSLEMVSKNPQEYSYIFGLYLGDGCTYRLKGNTYFLDIVQDSKYQNLIKMHCESLQSFFGRHPTIFKRQGCELIRIASNRIKFLFPKFGKGSKHLNKVFLPNILLDNLNHKELLKGLFQSDGCYYYDKSCKRFFYSFSNKSVDIINIYKMCLNNFGIGFDHCIKKSGTHLVNIKRKSEVPKMINLIGTKTDPK